MIENCDANLYKIDINVNMVFKKCVVKQINF